MNIDASIKQSSLWMLVRFFVSLTLGVFVTTYVIRSLSVKEYGIYTVLYSMIGYIGVLGAFGIPAVFQRYIPESLQRKEYAVIKKLIFNGLVLRFLLSCATVCLILFLHNPIGELLKLDGFIGYLSIFAWGILLYLETQLLTNVLNSLFLHKYSVISNSVYILFRGACVVILLESGLGIKGLLLTEVLSWAVWTALQVFFYYIKFVRVHSDEHKQVAIPLKRYFRYGGYSILNELGSSVLSVSTDFFVITAFLGPEAVGFYAFADKVIKILVRCMPHMLLKDVIRPAFFAKYAQNSDPRVLGSMFNLLLKLGAFFIFPLTAGILVLGGSLISIVFKADYLGALPILSVLAVFISLNVFFQPIGLCIKAIEQVQYTLYSKVFALYNLAGALIAVQWFGVMGVVLMSCSGVLFKNIFLFYCMRKHLDFNVDWRGLAVIGANAFMMALILWPFRFYADKGILFFILISLSGAGLYFLFSFFNKSFTLKERGWMNNLLPIPIFLF